VSLFKHARVLGGPSIDGPLMSVTVALAARDEVGEGPVWDDVTARLLRVDVPLCAVKSWNPATGQVEVTTYDQPVSAVIVRRSSPGWVVATGRDIVIQEPARRVVLATVDGDRPGNRLNDCKCDRQGRIWAGTLSTDHAAHAGSLYRVDPDGAVELALRGTTVSNGLGWSPAGDTMYFIDSATRRIDAFDFDAAPGRISGRRTVVAIDAADGLPDGMAVDAEGGLWVCLFGGGAVRRYSPAGEFLAEIRLPVTIPTCPTFGGPLMDILYVTSARRHLSPSVMESEHDAGAVLAIKTEVRGAPTARFDG